MLMVTPTGRTKLAMGFGTFSSLVTCLSVTGSVAALELVVNATSCAEQRDAPRYSPEDLSLCMQGYSIDRAMLLSNGMQEFLFRL